MYIFLSISVLARSNGSTAQTISTPFNLVSILFLFFFMLLFADRLQSVLSLHLGRSRRPMINVQPPIISHFLSILVFHQTISASSG